jgi:1,4-dihydroxy-2-naphthoate octaprenyltransferase
MPSNPWLSAIRLRTLPLALSSIGMGGFLAAAAGKFSWTIFLLCCLTTIFLQILSNLANDYGDSVNGADHAGRKGPQRAVQSGTISMQHMRNAVILLSVLSLASGVSLLWISLEWHIREFLFFLGLGVLCILAAIAYTVGKKPYGYAGLGDISVLIFFGLVGVLGSTYLMTKTFVWIDVLPALSCGLFSVAVLNINNVRDIESDKAAGKFSVPVRIGKQKAALYHSYLLLVGTCTSLLYVILNFQSAFQLLFLLVFPILIKIMMAVKNEPSEKLDPWLKRMALTTLAFVILFGVGLLYS